MPRGKGPTFKNNRSHTIEDKEIGLRLRAMRIDKKLSQDDLGAQLGVSFQQIQKYEKGVNRLSAVRLMKIARIFKTNPLEIMGWDDKLERNAGAIFFDTEAYRLAKEFVKLPDITKPKIRALIATLIKNEGGDVDE